jgi:hypothetical protein
MWFTAASRPAHPQPRQTYMRRWVAKTINLLQVFFGRTRPEAFPEDSRERVAKRDPRHKPDDAAEDACALVREVAVPGGLIPVELQRPQRAANAAQIPHSQRLAISTAGRELASIGGEAQGFTGIQRSKFLPAWH